MSNKDLMYTQELYSIPGGSDNKDCLWCRRHGFDPWVGNIL